MKKILFSLAFFAAVLVASAQGGVYLNEGLEDSEFPPPGWTVLILQGDSTTIYGSEVEFSTYSCDAPTGLHATDVGLNYIILEWDDDPNISAWQVWDYPHGYGGIPDGGIETDTNYYSYPYEFVIYDPSPYHPGYSPLYYDFAVRALCDENTWGPWSGVITVATAYVGIEERLKNSVALFPNPANDHVNVRADGDVNVSDMAVYDVYGKIITVVETVCTPSLQAQIDVSNLSAGMYFIRITTDHGTITKPFVKR